LFKYLTPYWWGYDRLHFMYNTGAFAIVFSVSESPALQSFFHNTLSRYFGRISFGLYLVHGPVCHMVGYALIPQLWAYTDGPVQAALDGLPAGASWTDEERVLSAKRPYEGGTEWGFEVGFLLGGLVVVPVTIWAADLFTRYIDEPVVRLARRIEMSVGPER
jgi:peptidoglycan/LPS O-acetylase OafA/YrhL